MLEATMTPGGLRVSVVDAGPDDPGPIVLELHDGDVTMDGTPIRARLEQVDPERALLREEVGRGTHRVLVLPATAPAAGVASGVTRREVVIDGWRLEVDVEPAARAALRDRARRGRQDAGHSGPTEVHAIIPGVVVSVSVAPGDAVAAGQQLLVVEAMKMQNELRAPRAGTIERVAVGAGARIDVGDLLLVIA
jgi:biotin carboxyl carrier protein